MSLLANAQTRLAALADRFSFVGPTLARLTLAVPSSKMTVTNDMPNIACPRTAVTRGEPRSDVTMG